MRLLVFAMHYDSRNSCGGIGAGGAKIPGSQVEGREGGILFKEVTLYSKGP